MTNCAGNAWFGVFPFRWWGSPQAYAAKTLERDDAKANIRALREAAAAQTDKDRLKEFCEITLKRLDDEVARQSSIITRAQALFAALALFSFLFTFGVGLFGQTAHMDRWVLWVCLAFVVYIVLQIAIMVFNVLRAIKGVSYTSPGSSDLARWLSLPSEVEMHRDRAVMAVEHYREAVQYNNWRFEHLECAFKGLRNIVLTLSALILFLLVAGALLSAPSPPVPAPPQLEPRWHGYWRHQLYD